MGFEALLGNEQLRQNLRSSLGRGRISHFYLISGPAGSGKHTLARLLSAAILCGSEEKPCHTCPACRKALADTHPDVITVTDPEHKNVAVKIVRQIRDDVFVRPNEGSHKIYIFPQELGIEGQNALLKILEEPPAYGVFILLADNPEKLLPTIRSRCTELSLTALPESLLRRELGSRFPDADTASVDAAVERSGGYLGQAVTLLESGAEEDPQTQNFVKGILSRDPMALLQALAPMEKWKRDQLIPVLTRWTEILHGALMCRSGMKSLSPAARQIGAVRSSADLMQAINHIQKAITYAQGNVSVAAICSWLSWVLR